MRIVASIVVGCLLTGCASSSATTAEPATEVVFAGIYAASADGPIDTVTFSSEGEYWLKNKDCSTSACLEQGTFRQSKVHGAISLVLTNASGAERTLSVDVLSVEKSDATSTASITPLDLLGSGSELTKAEADLLPGARAEKALLDGQPVELVASFDCYAKFFPDGSLAGPWVGSVRGGGTVTSPNRQICEEKLIAASTRKV